MKSATLLGIDAVEATVTVDLTNKLPACVLVGLPSAVVRETVDRVCAAIRASGFMMPRKRVMIEVGPADLAKHSSAHYDLPIALAILAASKQIPAKRLDGVAAFGELALDGAVRPVRGAIALAAACGDGDILVPCDNAAEAALESGAVYGVRSLSEAAGRSGQGPTPHPSVRSVGYNIDWSEVRGQDQAKRMLEVAAAGGHNILLISSPGCGKTMLAARLPTILPPMDDATARQVTRIHSVAGLLRPGEGLVTRRPFRAPHHTVSAAGMIGNARLMPGEMTLAHAGVLMLDELPEFQRSVIEVMRRPVQTGEVELVRAAGAVRLPANCIIVAAANPCPCGWLGHPTRPCMCSEAIVARYMARCNDLAHNLNIDIVVRVMPMGPPDLLLPDGESSETVRARVQTARDAQGLGSGYSPK